MSLELLQDMPYLVPHLITQDFHLLQRRIRVLLLREFIGRMVLLGAGFNELILKLGHLEERISLLVSELQLKIYSFTRVNWTNRHSEPPKSDVVDHHKAAFSTEVDLERGKNWFSPGQDV